jgi:hypothetical protein
MKLTRAALFAAAVAAAAFVPNAAIAAAAGPASGAIPYLAIAGIAWFALDKIIELLPIKDNTLVSLIRSALTAFFDHAQQKK